MATKRNCWSEGIHACVITLFEEFAQSFGKSEGFSVKYSIQKNAATFSTFVLLKFTHIEKNNTLCGMKFHLTIRNENDIEIIKSLFITIREQCDKISSKETESDHDNK